MQHYGLIRDHLTEPSYQVINHTLSFHQFPMYQQQLLHRRRFLTRLIIGTSRHHLIQLQQTQLIHYLQSHVLLSRSLEHHLCRPLCPTIHVHRLLTGQSIGTYQHQFSRRANQLIHPLSKVVPARNIHLQPHNNNTREVTVAKRVEKISI